MKKIKVTLTFTYETDFDEENWMELNPQTTLEEALQNREQLIIEDEIGRMETRAANVLPSNYEMNYNIQWEDWNDD